jgi:hypothetical protein
MAWKLGPGRDADEKEQAVNIQDIINQAQQEASRAESIGRAWRRVAEQAYLVNARQISKYEAIGNVRRFSYEAARNQNTAAFGIYAEAERRFSNL